MTDLAKQRWRCSNCDRIAANHQWLKAPHPFLPGHKTEGCPQCRTVIGDIATLLCDEPGCTRDGDSGWPTGDLGDEWGGYRQTCGVHSPWPRARVTP